MPPWPNGALNLPYGLINAQIFEFKNAMFIDVEAIVHISNPLAHLIEQAGGLQGRGAGFHGKFIPASNYRI
jgi:hypothetical protein